MGAVQNEFIYYGIKVSTDKSYYKFVEGSKVSVKESEKCDNICITYPAGMTSCKLAPMIGFTPFDDMVVPPTPPNGYVKYHPVTVSFNGLKFRKLTVGSHVVRIVLTDDNDTRVVQNYYGTTIVYNIKDLGDPKMKEYLFSNLRYLKLLDKSRVCWKDYDICDFPKIIVDKKNLELTSDNRHVYKLRNIHDVYLVKAIDYEHKFLDLLSKKLSDFGVELMRINREKTATITSYVDYAINQTPVKYIHPRARAYQGDIMCHTLVIDYMLHTPDMILYFDFKNRYNNVDFLTNFTEFKVKDSKGQDWTAAVKWGPITEDFNHRYNQDSNANFANECSFRSELYFYEVYDTEYYIIREIQQELGVIPPDDEGMEVEVSLY